MVDYIVKKLLEAIINDIPESQYNSISKKLEDVVNEIKQERELDLFSFLRNDTIIDLVKDRNLLEDCFESYDLDHQDYFIDKMVDYLTDWEVIDLVKQRNLQDEFFEENDKDISEFSLEEILDELKDRGYSMRNETLYYILDLIRTQPMGIKKMDAEAAIEFMLK